MRRIRRYNFTILVALMLLWLAVGRPAFVAADTANGPSLIISQLKITSSNGQFITLYNASDSTVDMSKYQLEYFNSYDLSKATSSRLIALSGTVPPHGYYMVNDSSLLLCYQLTIDSVSLGLSSTAGMIEVLAFNQANPGAPATPVLQDFVGWSKTTTIGVQTLPSSTKAFLQRQPVDASNNPAISSAGAGSWQSVQPDAGNACNLVTSATSMPVASGLSQLLPATEPPATIVSLFDDDAVAVTTSGIPTSNIGLMAPSISELLPNPNGTGNDSTDEYIELYNPNNTSFDLTGFVLRTGLSSFHNYTFPAGTKLSPHSFTAFYSEATGLSLSNTGSQVKLLDPSGNSISATGAYVSAKDGQAWALAKGKWYWTTSPTANAANIIKQPAPKKSKAASKAKAAKANAAKTKTKKPKTSQTAASTNFNEQPATTPIHVRTLALVAGGALLYGLYEYRKDLANGVYQFRRYLKARWGSRA